MLIRARAEGHLFAGNDQVFNWYFWKGPTLGFSKYSSGGLEHKLQFEL